LGKAAQAVRQQQVEQLDQQTAVMVVAVDMQVAVDEYLLGGEHNHGALCTNGW
jgi:hypothetical protein